MKKEKLEVLKVDPAFKRVFKFQASKSGCPTLAEYTRTLARDMAEKDVDVSSLLLNKSKLKRRGSYESFFRV